MFTLRKLGVIAAAVAVGSVLTVAGAGIAAANGSGGQRPPAVVSQHATSSMCISLWAFVNKNGTLERAGCPGTKSKYLGFGYQVVFPRNVRHCAYVATVGDSGSQGIPPADFPTVAGRLGLKDGVFIEVYDTTGMRVQHGFYLLVECHLPNIP
jgi:hypothetical protein